MILHHAPQGSPEWKAARAGVISASNFKLLRADAKLKSGPSKGDYSSATKDYAFRLAIERISGVPLDEGFETWSMARGHELEPVARMKHEASTGLMVETVGFVTSDDGRFGASADGLIDDDGGAEYKCFVSPEKLREILLYANVSEVMDQCQGGMWLTDRKWWDFCLYCPALEAIGRDLTRFRLQRDDDYIERLVGDLIAFENLVSEYEASLRGVKAPPAMVPPWEPAPSKSDPAQPLTHHITIKKEAH